MWIIDTREPTKDRIVYQLKKWSIKSHVMKLECADYYLPNLAFCIERKTISDMLSDFKRLDDQLLRCKQMYQNTALLLEGNYSFDATSGEMMRREGDSLVPTGVRHTAFQNKLLSLALLHGIFVLRTNNLNDTMLLLRNLHEWSQKPVHRVLSFDGSEMMRTQNLYASIPGIGEELSKRVAEKFPVPPIPSDFADKLRDIKGFSDSKVEQARRYLRGDWLVRETDLEDFGVEDDR